MAKFADLISQKNLDELFSHVEDVVLELPTHRAESAPSMKYTFPPANTQHDKAVELSMPVIKWLHTQLWNRSQPATGLPAPFMREYKGALISIIRESKLTTIMTEEQARLFASDLYRYLRLNKLAVRAHYGQGGNHRVHKWYVAEWPNYLNSSTFGVSGDRSQKDLLTKKDESRMVARVQQEADKPITHKFDIKQIPLPSSNPDEIVDYVKKIAALFRQLNSAYEEVLTEVSNIRKQEEKLKWEETASAIAAAING